ncbi:hypothetical protein AB4876_14320 [Zhongshania guokunii]|uniref:Choice-of-anchor G family protein n=1 Tax=Zhongshania guokunii TaxID=641783 RepID=A0ABV3UAF3_9GAMM
MFTINAKGICSSAVFIVALAGSGALSAQSLPVVSDFLASTNGLLDVGLVLGGDMLSGSLLDDTLNIPNAGLVLSGDLIDSVGSSALSVPTSAPSTSDAAPTQ